MTKLIIVESPGKINTIKKYAGPGHTVKASIGHIKDLPKKELGIDVKNDFACKFVISDGKEDVVADLKKAAKSADQVFLATDPDREGECIAQHLAEELKVSGKCRITFNEITEKAIKNALKNPREINTNKVNAQTTRRVLDRLVGYSISPHLWRKVAPKTSAGRVQSAALLLISQKEREIRRFVSQDYWTVHAVLSVDGYEIESTVVDKTGKVREFKTEAEAILALKEVQSNPITFVSSDKKTESRSPYPPFITSTLQQACAAALSLSAHQTMQVAQKLYEGVTVPGHGEVALITYMRTDSTRSSPEAITAARDYISTSLDKKYLPGTPRSYTDKKKKNQQDAHEAVRPTHIEIDPTLVSDNTQKKVYDIVWRRFVASQMSNAQVEQTRLTFKAREIFLEVKGNKILFDGFLKIYKLNVDEQELPDIVNPKNIKLTSSKETKHTTQPPRRYSEAQLIKTLEKEGIGRPSTYATIIKTIVDRGYVTKEKGSFSLTEIGLLVNDQLQKEFPNIISLKFTSDMEENLDKIENGESWTEIVSSFYSSMKESLKAANKNDKLSIKTNLKCPKCSQTMVLKYGQNGRFVACMAYPSCKSTRDVGDGINILASIDCYMTSGVEIPECATSSTAPCPKCGSELRRKTSKFGPFFGCSGYPECKYTKNISNPVIKCPDCDDGNIVEKGKAGKKFWACDQYPDCKKLFNQKPTENKCPSCNGHLVEYKKKEVCSEKNCEKYVQTGKFFKKKGRDA